MVVAAPAPPAIIIVLDKLRQWSSGKRKKHRRFVGWVDGLRGPLELAAEEEEDDDDDQNLDGSEGLGETPPHDYVKKREKDPLCALAAIYKMAENRKLEELSRPLSEEDIQARLDAWNQSASGGIQLPTMPGKLDRGLHSKRWVDERKHV